MSAVATIEQNSAPAVPKQTKPARLSPRVRQAIELIVRGRVATQKAAAEAVGLTEEWLCKALAKPTAQVFIERESRRTIAQGTMRASARLMQLVDASSEHVSLDATKHVLAIGNIRPPDAAQANVNVNVSVGYVIDLTPGAPPSSAPDIRTQIIEHDQGDV